MILSSNPHIENDPFGADRELLLKYGIGGM
jgi:hypothetical protein